MDKTGTITKGNFKVQDVIPLGNATRHEILSLAASCEESSTHPIGKSIMEAAKDENERSDVWVLVKAIIIQTMI